MKKIIVVTLLIASAKISFGQSTYSKAIGVKFPAGFSVSYKDFLTDTRNLEAQATIWNKGFKVSGLYEFNFYVFNNADGLALFAGPGAHIGFWKQQYKSDYGSTIDIGIDGIIGLDYKFKDAPINLSVDWQPSITLIGSAGFAPASGGLAVRYTF